MLLFLLVLLFLLLQVLPSHGSKLFASMTQTMTTTTMTTTMMTMMARMMRILQTNYRRINGAEKSAAA